MICSGCVIQFNLKNRKPILLPCGHTFCLKCIYKMKKEGMIKCFIDKKIYDNQTNYPLNSSKMEILKKELEKSQKQEIQNMTIQIIDEKMSKITDNYDFNFKIITLGNSFVGKSALLNRYFYNIFEKNTNPTITVDFFTKNLNINKKSVLLTAYDTAGSENFMSITKRYVQNKHCILFTFDTSSKKSFSDLKNWIKFANEVKREDCVCIVVGTKIDNGERQVESIEGMNFAKIHDMAYFEISSKDGENIEKLFRFCVLRCFRVFRNEENKKKVEEFRVFSKKKNRTGCFGIIKKLFGF